MTSTAVFHLGSAGAGGASTESHFSWSIQHPRSLNFKPSIARSQDDSWSPPLPRGSWVSSWHSGVPNGQINTDPYRAYNPLQGPFRARSGRQRQRPFESSSQSSFQEPLPDSLPVLVRESVLGTDDAGDYREVLQDVPPTPVEWLAPPQQEEDSWKGTPRRWKIPGQGVMSLLPWFLGMSVVGGAENPAGTRRQRPLADEPSAPRATTYRPPSRPAPGPNRTPKGSGDDMSTSNGRLKVLYQWKTIDYEFPNEATRTMAISNGAFIPENNLPLGVEAYRDRLFVSIPRWKPGVPATIAYLPKNPNGDVSARLKPYPDWSWHRVPRVGVNDSCQAFTSVFRMTVDECGRLWILDSGAVDAIGDIRSVCPPQIIVFDLNTDQLLWRYIIPKEQTKPESLFTSIVVDIRDNDCMNAYAYAADVFRYGLLVYSWREDRSYRLSHNFFFPDPIAARFNLDNITFRWMDGIFGLALSPVNMQTRDRALFFHPMASFREFAVRTSVIRNETYANNNPDEFKIIGLRGRTQAHSSASAMDRRGVLFFNLVTQDALGCWDSAKTYGKGSVGHVAQDKAVLNFPNDLKVDREEPQNIWLLTNRLHIYLYRNLSRDEYNYRILTGTVEKATEGTICDPSRSGPLTSVPKEIDACEDV